MRLQTGRAVGAPGLAFLLFEIGLLRVLEILTLHPLKWCHPRFSLRLEVLGGPTVSAHRDVHFHRPEFGASAFADQALPLAAPESQQLARVDLQHLEFLDPLLADAHQSHAAWQHWFEGT